MLPPVTPLLATILVLTFVRGPDVRPTQRIEPTTQRPLVQHQLQRSDEAHLHNLSHLRRAAGEDWRARGNFAAMVVNRRYPGVNAVDGGTDRPGRARRS